MKKIFLIPLLTLLCTVMAWGDEIAEMKVGTATKSYESMSALQADIDTLSVPAVVTLKKTIELSAANAYTFRVPAGKDITLNLNGFNFIQTFDPTAASGEGYWAYSDGTPVPADEIASTPAYLLSMIAHWVPGSSNADIDENALIYNKGTLHIISEGNSIVQLICRGNVTLDQATCICNAGNLTVDAGIFIGPHQTIKTPVIWCKDEHETLGSYPSVIINGGTFLCDESVSDYNNGPDFGPIWGDAGTRWVINGGIFSSDEMAGTWVKKNGGEDKNKYTTSEMFTLEGKAYYGYLGEHRTAIEVPYTNATIPEYTREWRISESNPKRVIDQVDETCPATPGNEVTEFFDSESNDIAKGVFQHYRFAIKKVCVVVPTNADPDNFLYVSENTTITVPDGETLRVGARGIVMGDAASKIIVAAGGKLISEGEIVTSTPDNLHLTMDEVNKKYSYVAFHTAGPLAKHPDATVVLKSKAKCENGVYTYQRFAVPTYRNNIARKQSAENTAFTYDKVAAPTAIYRWDYSADDWTVLAPAGDDTFEPFQGYDLTTSAAAAGTEYTFKCELVGRGNAVLPLQAGRKWQYFANSYTAPIDVVNLVTDLKNNKDYLNAGVWVHKINQNGWDGISLGDVEDHLLLGDELYQELIQPMQAFVFNLTGSAANTELDYDNLVFNPMLSAANSAAGAPRRRVANVDYTRATIAIEAADGSSDLVKVYEGSEFDATINNGYDMPKLMNEEGVNMYFNATEGNLARFASDNVANTAITLETKEATSYTMNFKNVSLEGYVLRDNLTGTETPLVSGYTYSFSAPANSKIEGRFEIVAAAHMPTAIEDVEVNANVKGIYTLTGQYMGENFHVLPAGVYVINGKKVVK